MTVDAHITPTRGCKLVFFLTQLALSGGHWSTLGKALFEGVQGLQACKWSIMEGTLYCESQTISDVYGIVHVHTWWSHTFALCVCVCVCVCVAVCKCMNYVALIYVSTHTVHQERLAEREEKLKKLSARIKAQEEARQEPCRCWMCV